MDWSPTEENPNDKPMYNEEQIEEINANIEVSHGETGPGPCVVPFAIQWVF